MTPADEATTNDDPGVTTTAQARPAVLANAAGALASSRWLWLELLAATAAFFFYVVIQRAAIPSYDGTIMLDVGRNIALHSALHTTPAVDYLHLATPYAPYGIGNSLLAAAVVALHNGETASAAPLVTLINPALLAISAGLLVATGRRLGWRPLVAVVTALIFADLTMAAHFSTEFFSEPAVTFGWALLMWGISRATDRPVVGLASAAAGVAIALLCRPDSVVLVAPALLFVYSPRAWKETVSRYPQRLLALLPVVAALAWICWYNWYRYGSLTGSGYEGMRFSNPLWAGLQLFLVSFGKGFFWFNPILLVGLVGLPFLWRDHRRLAAAVAFGCMARPLFYAKWSAAEGGITWGPRFLLPCCLLLAVGAGVALQRLADLRTLPRRLAQVAIGALALASGMVSIASWYVPYEQYYVQMMASMPGASLPELAVRIHNSYYRLSESQIVANLRLLDHAHPMGLEHFRGGASRAGLLAAILAAGFTGAALIAAWRWRPPTRPDENVRAATGAGPIVDATPLTTSRPAVSPSPSP